MTPGALANKKYRKKYPEKRNPERRRNYASTAGPKLNRNHKQLWQIWEINILEMGLHSDRKLHRIIGRSIQAIQMMRWKLKKETKEAK